MGVLIYAVFKTFLKHILKIHLVKELIEIIEYQNVFWSDFCHKWLDVGQILVPFSGKIGQIVCQILESLSQILIISTLHLGGQKMKNRHIFYKKCIWKLIFG